MRAALLLLSLAACGRVGFDPLVTATNGAGDAGTDATQAAACQSYSAWSQPVELADFTTVGDDWEPAMSPDGMYLAFGRSIDALNLAPRVGDGFGASRDISELDMTGFDSSIAWSFGGDEIYYSRNPSGNTVDFDLWRASAVNGVFIGPQQVAGFAAASPQGVALSPDGLELYYGHREGGTSLHRAVRASRTSPWIVEGLEPGVQVADAQTGWPSVSSDGLTLYYEIITSSQTLLYTATRATTADRFGRRSRSSSRASTGRWAIRTSRPTASRCTSPRSRRAGRTGTSTSRPVPASIERAR